MKKIIALFLALTMLLSLAACGKQEQSIDLSGKLDKLPTKQEQTEKPETPAVTEPEKPGKENNKTEKPEEPEIIVDPEPSQGLDAYDNPSDHPHEGFDLTVFDGIYRANLPQGDDEVTWLQITGFNDFIMLEYHGLTMDKDGVDISVVLSIATKPEQETNVNNFTISLLENSQWPPPNCYEEISSNSLAFMIQPQTACPDNEMVR